ncbi:MAG TPA: hypothetical protein DCZ76_01585 [Treponema sp.]|nr:hypothetical protein [Treponema sp.]
MLIEAASLQSQKRRGLSRDWRGGEAVAPGNGAGQGPAEPRKARNKRPSCRLLLMFATFALTNDAPSVALLVRKRIEAGQFKRTCAPEKKKNSGKANG